MLLTPTKHSKAFASPSALEASTLEAILTCPQPADSWWSASDFRRYLVGLEAAGEVPELPSVVVIARALNKSELFGVSRTRPDEGRLLYRVRPCVGIKSSTRLQFALMRPFRREIFCCASRTR